jgi:hypothetical protein
VSQYVQNAKESAEDAAETLARSFEHEVGLELANDALMELVDRLGVDVQDRRDAQLLLRFGNVDEDRNQFAVTLTTGLHHWMSAGWERQWFLNAEGDVQLKEGHYRIQAKHLLG